PRWPASSPPHGRSPARAPPPAPPPPPGRPTTRVRTSHTPAARRAHRCSGHRIRHRGAELPARDSFLRADGHGDAVMLMHRGHPRPGTARPRCDDGRVPHTPPLPVVDGIGPTRLTVPPTGPWPTPADFGADRFPALGAEAVRARFAAGGFVGADGTAAAADAPRGR